MTVLQQLLLLPLLAPLLAVLLLAAINPRPPVALRVLIWTSPALPLGGWMAAAAAMGAGLSAAATTLALRQVRPVSGGQQRRRPWPPQGSTPGEQPPAASRSAAPGWMAGAGPSRSPGEPAPTVEVPFRVIRKARAAATSPASAAAPAAPAATAVGDGWDQPLSNDWD